MLRSVKPIQLSAIDGREELQSVVIADCAAFVGNESEPPFTRTKERSTYTVSLIARQSETREGCRKKKGERERKKGLVCEAINRVHLMRRRTCYSNRIRGNANSLLNASVRRGKERLVAYRVRWRTAGSCDPTEASAKLETPSQSAMLFYILSSRRRC